MIVLEIRFDQLAGLWLNDVSTSYKPYNEFANTKNIIPKMRALNVWNDPDPEKLDIIWLYCNAVKDKNQTYTTVYIHLCLADLTFAVIPMTKSIAVIQLSDPQNSFRAYRLNATTWTGRKLDIKISLELRITWLSTKALQYP